MPYRKVHLHLAVQPTPTSDNVIDFACAVAREFEARLSVSSPRLKVSAPSHWLAGTMISGMAHEIEKDAAGRGLALEARLTQQASALGIPVQITRPVMDWPYASTGSSWSGRTSDVCVLGLPRQSTDQRLEVEDWLFGVGRPCLLCPDDSLHGFSLDRVLVAWDFSRSAARAIGDAIPLLRRAKQVRVAVVRGEKDIPHADAGEPLIEFLAAHGISGEVDEFEIEGRTVGQAILENAKSANASLVVLGAFGHSRLKEFLLGGVTKEVLDSSRIPLFMSH